MPHYLSRFMSMNKLYCFTQVLIKIPNKCFVFQTLPRFLTLSKILFATVRDSDV